jgi:hypothetical protein
MVTITNHAPLSQVFKVKDGAKVRSKSLPPGVTDEFDLINPKDPFLAWLQRDGQISIATPQPAPAQTGPLSPPAASVAQPKPNPA